jgi:hypothetical protein
MATEWQVKKQIKQQQSLGASYEPKLGSMKVCFFLMHEGIEPKSLLADGTGLRLLTLLPSER